MAEHVEDAQLAEGGAGEDDEHGLSGRGSTFRWRGRAPDLSTTPSFGKGGKGGGKGGKGKKGSVNAAKNRQEPGETAEGAERRQLDPPSDTESSSREKGRVRHAVVSRALGGGMASAIVGECGAGKSRKVLSAILGELAAVVPASTKTAGGTPREFCQSGALLADHSTDHPARDLDAALWRSSAVVARDAGETSGQSQDPASSRFTSMEGATVAATSAAASWASPGLCGASTCLSSEGAP